MVVGELIDEDVDRLFHALAVAVLERAGLVTKQRRGREHLVRTDPDAIGRARRVLDEVETAWRGRVDRMADLLAHVPQPEPNELSKGHGQ